MKQFLSIVLLFLISNAVQAQQTASKVRLKKLAKYMIGSYNSAKQAQQDTAYYNISLEMCRVWKQEKGGIWLYVEQAATAKKDKPYRQRVYQLKQVNDSTLSSTIYSLPDAKKAIGAYANKTPLNYWTPNDLTLLKGCTIFLKFVDGQFVGSTKEGTCENSWGEAAYATSEVSINKNTLISWDRGWSKDKKHVWGAEKGGYIFDKIK